MRLKFAVQSHSSLASLDLGHCYLNLDDIGKNHGEEGLDIRPIWLPVFTKRTEKQIGVLQVSVKITSA